MVGKAERCTACTSGWCSLKPTANDARVLAGAGQTLSFLKGMATNIRRLDQQMGAVIEALRGMVPVLERHGGDWEQLEDYVNSL